MKIIIIGEGELIYHLPQKFISKGHKVSLVNKDRDYCKFLSRNLDCLVIQGDGTSPNILEEAGANKADVILALTPKDEDNLFICQMAKKEFGIEQTFSIVNNPENETIFKKLGVHTVFNITELISILIDQRVESSDVVNLFSIEEGRLSIFQITISSDSPALNRSLKEVDLPRDIVLTSIVRGDEVIVPRGETILKEKDKVLVMTFPENQAEAIKLLSGEK